MRLSPILRTIQIHHVIIYTAKLMAMQMIIWLEWYQIWYQPIQIRPIQMPIQQLAMVFRRFRINFNSPWIVANVVKSGQSQMSKKMKNTLNDENETMRRPKNQEMHAKYVKIGLAIWQFCQIFLPIFVDSNAIILLFVFCIYRFISCTDRVSSSLTWARECDTSCSDPCTKRGTGHLTANDMQSSEYLIQFLWIYLFIIFIV